MGQEKLKNSIPPYGTYNEQGVVPYREFVFSTIRKLPHVNLALLILGCVCAYKNQFWLVGYIATLIVVWGVFEDNKWLKKHDSTSHSARASPSG